MTTPALTAAAAYAIVAADHGLPFVRSTAFLCPYPNCRTYALHHWGIVQNLTVYPTEQSASSRQAAGTVIVTALCEACASEVVFINGRMIHPEISEAPSVAADLPADLAEDYAEAGRVLPVSPRGAAALLRLVVQKLLPLIGATPDDINRMIGQLVSDGKITPAIQQALDSVRIIGNEAVHPGLLDLKDDQRTAVSLFNLINFIVEKAITEPREIAAIYAGLPPGKLAGVAQRDTPTT